MAQIMPHYIADTNILIAHFANKLTQDLPLLLGISVISDYYR
ncbi:hypothetical protein SPONN_1207 [uncultured Candidatus Thioglobus sp.]|nr:hypothetical protein SPONN_1207 [uncultured Candidatus Thioglobus sp.]